MQFESILHTHNRLIGGFTKSFWSSNCLLVMPTRWNTILKLFPPIHMLNSTSLCEEPHSPWIQLKIFIGTVEIVNFCSVYTLVYKKCIDHRNIGLIISLFLCILNYHVYVKCNKMMHRLVMKAFMKYM